MTPRNRSIVFEKKPDGRANDDDAMRLRDYDYDGWRQCETRVDRRPSSTGEDDDDDDDVDASHRVFIDRVVVVGTVGTVGAGTHIIQEWISCALFR